MTRIALPMTRIAITDKALLLYYRASSTSMRVQSIMVKDFKVFTSRPKSDDEAWNSILQKSPPLNGFYKVCDGDKQELAFYDKKADRFITSEHGFVVTSWKKNSPTSSQ
ncbi:MAG: hypothetical protein V2I33_06615 [Kangiellaceae bacterium]|nr:hypothetical protein [Kangiellaceae bacterium]